MASAIFAAGGAGFFGANILTQAGRGTGVHAVDLSDAEALRRLVLSLNLFAIVSFSA